VRGPRRWTVASDADSRRWDAAVIRVRRSPDEPGSRLSTPCGGSCSGRRLLPPFEARAAPAPAALAVAPNQGVRNRSSKPGREARSRRSNRGNRRRIRRAPSDRTCMPVDDAALSHGSEMPRTGRQFRLRVRFARASGAPRRGPAKPGRRSARRRNDVPIVTESPRSRRARRTAKLSGARMTGAS
jgi:hypothetical protein